MKILVVGNGHSLLDIKNVKARARSGGETKLIRNLQRWRELGADIWILCPEVTKTIFGYVGVTANFITLPKFYDRSRFGLLATFLKRILGCFFRKIPQDFDIIYSSSDFLFDLIPSIYAKCENKKAKLVTCLYLVAPHPLKGYERVLMKGFTFPTPAKLIYYFSQKLSIFLIRCYADRVLVFNDYDKKFLVERGILSGKIAVVSGGVDIGYVSGIRGDKNLQYDACFLGRLQPQKGIFDLIEIWKEVCRKRKDAKLALIGGGSKRMYGKLKSKIREKNLQANIDVLGFLEEDKIFKILKSSKCFLCPSRYESWGIVMVEAMACGLPVVAYDLPVFRKIFPQGVISIPIGDTQKFSSIVYDLLESESLRKKLSSEALQVSLKYEWNKIAEEELRDLENLVGEVKK